MADPTLIHEADALAHDPRFVAAVVAHWPLGGAPAPAALRMAVHPGDQMLTHSLMHHRHAGAAVSQYFQISLQQYGAMRQVLEACFDDPAGVDVLDFACGYGRLLRLLAAVHPSRRLFAAELQQDAVEFVTRTFGVTAVASHASPEAFEPGRSFDFIWVASLFSHLPRTLFDAWLARLVALLSPRGVLCFSVRGAELLPGGRMPDDGFAYFPESENADLGADIYGTTYATEPFVRAALARAGAAPTAIRLEKALAHEQDLYVCARSANRALANVRRFRRGPWGWVDRRTLEGRRLVLQGWAASLDDGPLDEVTVLVDGVAHRAATGASRPDVAAAFGDPRLASSGWSLDIPHAGSDAFVVVSARSMRGESALLYAGPVEA